MATTSPAANIIIGTAGHVDHGKTALIERLTGIDADRLQEEKERGLTIDLGFAWFDLPSGAHVGIVDVPGHERFIKNMLAGATGIDLFLLVVAADEGVMPQTREHLTILDVLQIRAGLVVITKGDLVDAEMLQLVTEDIAKSLEGTAFEHAPTVVTSAKTGQGLDELVGELDKASRDVKPRDIAGPARLQVDRSFTMKGFGTVVTGALIRGTLRINDELEVLPRGLTTRVRSMEVHGQQMNELTAPARVGVNVAGIARQDVERGDQLVAPGSMAPSWMLDVRVGLAADAGRPLIYRERVRVHHGAAEVLGRVVLLESDALAPGQDALAQLRLEGPVVAAAGDHFVIRRYSPAQTIGGGVVLDPAPARHRRRETEVLGRLRHLEAGTEADRAHDWIDKDGAQGFDAAQLALGLQMDAGQAEALIEEALETGEVVDLAPGRYLSTARADELLDRVVSALREYHRERPLQAVMPTTRLQAALQGAPTELRIWAVGVLKQQGAIAAGDGGWRLADHEVGLSEDQQQALSKLEELAQAAGMSPPSREEALEALAPQPDAPALLDYALAQGSLVSVAEFITSPQVLKRATGQLAELYAQKGPLTVADVRTAWESSRKYVVPILEYLDSTGLTRRDGSVRHVKADR